MLAPMNVHFVAVAGTGMGSLAGLFQAAGHRVTGSDSAFYPPMGPALRRWGIELYEGFDPKHLEPAPDLVVVGNVCRSTNPEARAAIDRGLRVTTMAHALAEHVLAGTSPLVVAGTHGKTTTSALCAWLLAEVGLAPGFLIGGLPQGFEESFRLPGSPPGGRASGAHERSSSTPRGARATPFVVEGDEYDTAFFEKTPKFWHYRPEIAMVTSIEHDHVDIYPDEPSYVAAFRGFVDRIPPHGLLVAHAADDRVVATVASAAAPVLGYAIDGEATGPRKPTWVARGLEARGDRQSFEVWVDGAPLGRATTTLPGRYNVRNALGALAAVSAGFGVPFEQAAKALESFRGVKRRQEVVGEVRGVRVIDDFAHHPTAVRETSAGLRERFPAGKLWVVYEARSATACRRMHQQAYESAFDAADRVLFAPIGRPEIPAAERLDLGLLVQALAARGRTVELCASIDAIVARVAAEARAGDTVALLSNGAFGGIHGKLLDALRAGTGDPAA
jgi:UDP-N-acetylmuramate: L-alanyl-gamma-D-glutamyl-meso-diaminopimelate ligase